MTDSQNLLAEYVQTRSDAAFRELVTRYVDLVYSTASRLVEGDTHRAEDVAQTVFTDLARMALTLSHDVMLGGWLHRHTCFVAINTMRGERRRRSRERQAVEMNALRDNSGADFSLVAPILDEAVNELGEEDRKAVMLRFFEQHDFRSLGRVLGSTEDAARMRVARALKKLQGLLKRRGVTTSYETLSLVLSANAVQAAPVGLAITISTAALAGTSIAATATATATKVIAMTTLQKSLIAATVLAAVGTGVYEARQVSHLRDENQTLQQQHTPLAEQIRQLTSERDDAINQLTARRDDNEKSNRTTAELLKLRGQAGALRQELAALKRHMGQPDSQSNDSGKTWVIGDIKWKPEWKDLGLSSPDAAVQTYWWAVANTNAERIKQCMVFDRLTNAVPVSDLFAKRESRANQGFYQSGWAARLAAVTQDSPYRARLQIEWMAQVPAETAPSFNPAEPPKWSPERTETLEVMRNQLDGEWKIIGNEGRVMLTLDDEDSEAVAKMLMRMPPEQVEDLKSKIPEPTLRVYEEMKTRGVK